MSLLEKSPITQPFDPNHVANPSPDDRLEQAMADLKAAAASREIERICGAYAVVRKRMPGAKVREVLQRVERALGPQARLILVSSYSHRQCFMCDGGMIPCDPCDGQGSIDGRTCGSCDGFGVQECTFCRGTAWADPQTIPAELRRPVHEWQFHAVQSDLKRLKDEFQLTPDRVARIAPEHRRRVGAWLMKLEARLTDLEEQARLANDLSNQTAFGTAVSEIGQLLQRLAATLGR